MSRQARWVVLLAFLLAGCGDDEPGNSSGGPGPALETGDFSVRVDRDAQRVELVRADQVLLALDADAFVLGTVDEVSDAASYDPVPMLEDPENPKEPAGLAWHVGTALEVVESAADRLALRITHDGELESTVELTINGEGSFRALLVPSDPTPVALLALRPRIDETEGFYGLGEYFDRVEHRGMFRAMQIEPSGKLESNYNEAHVPVPFVTGTKGWGLFVENAYPACFDVARTDPERLAATFGTGLASDDGLVFHLFAAAHPLDVTARYYQVTAPPALPARWGLGPLVWRDENDDQAQVEADVQAMRDLDLPASAIWIDRPYATGVNTFDFSATKFTDAPAMIAKIHDLGFRLALWHTPYLDKKDAATQTLLAEAQSKGYYPSETGIQLNGWGTLLDLTNPDAVSWWQGLLKKYLDLGVEGFKLDYGEDVIVGLLGARTPWKFSDGSDERTMHARYQIHYHRTYADLFPEEGSFLLCRGGTYGDQRHCSVIWPGDLDASFAKQGEQVTQGTETYVAVGGLPGALIAGLSLGPSGYPFFGADTGGYQHSPPDKELFTRWFQVTALSTVMQIGTSSNDVAWEPTPGNGFDLEMLGWYREYTRLHQRLFPYLWTYAQRLKQDGRPIQRALGLAHPELGVHPDDTFLLGDYLLVAPILERGKTARDVVLPAGDWLDWWTGQRVSGGKTITVDAPLDTLPLFLAAGGIVPLLRPTIDTLSPVADPGAIDSYATTPGVLWARVAPGPASTFALFDGSELGQNDTGATLELSSKDGSELAQGVVFEVLGFGAAPSGVTDGGSALGQVADLTALTAAGSGWTYDAASGSLFVAVGSGTHAIVVTR